MAWPINELTASSLRGDAAVRRANGPRLLRVGHRQSSPDKYDVPFFLRVLLPADDFNWIRNLLGDEPDAPRVQDSRTNAEYALLPELRYERFKAFFEEDPLSQAERTALLREAGKRAGWDDAIFDEPDPQGAP